MQAEWEKEASWGDLFISILFSCHSIKIQRRILYELVKEKRKLSIKSFNTNLYRLKKKNLLTADSDGNIIIDKNNLKSYTIFSRIKDKPTGETRIIILFDIPEKRRKNRNWLREQLKIWDFKMIQKSFWIGKGVPPKEFTDRLRLLGIDKCIKIFKIQKI